MGIVRCEKCGGVCRGGAACPGYGNPNAGEVVLTERERLVAEVKHSETNFASAAKLHDRALHEWQVAYRALREYDRTHPKEARDV